MRPEDSDLLTSWESAPLPAVVSHIVDAYHRPGRRLMARIRELHAEALQGHGEAYPVVERMTPHLEALFSDLQEHFRWEEQSLFPAILAKDTGRTGQASLAEEEHAAAEELLVNLRAVTSDYAVPPDAPPALQSLMATLVELETSLHRHIFLETHVLFARGVS